MKWRPTTPKPCRKLGHVVECRACWTVVHRNVKTYKSRCTHDDCTHTPTDIHTHTNTYTTYVSSVGAITIKH